MDTNDKGVVTRCYQSMTLTQCFEKLNRE